MQNTRFLAAAAFALSALGTSTAYAQTAASSGDIPEGYETLPVEYAETITPATTDNVETVTRTRWISRDVQPSAVRMEPEMTHHGADYAQHGYAPYPASYPVTFDRETWLEECHARTRGVDREKRGGIIGALLGAISGGIIGNRVWDSERLAGTLIGGGLGGLAGAAIGSAIDSGKKSEPVYDCEAALDRYMSGTSYPVQHVAYRNMPAPYYGAYAPAYAYAPVQAPACACQQPMAMIEVREEIPQRVVVRERVREEWVDEPALPREPARRIIEEPQPPAPTKLIKQSGKSVPIKRKSIKGS